MIIPKMSLLADGDLGAFAWSHLRRFHNVPYVTDLLKQRYGSSDKSGNFRKQAEQLRYCLLQAREYADAADAVSLATKPNLLYYSIMSLALAEILFKQDGDSSLDRARDQHRHHGLQLSPLSLPKTVTDLKAVASSLRAVPMLRANGERYGTFELWHRSSREAPVGGKITRRVGNGSITTFGMLLGAEDVKIKLVSEAGVSLFECVTRIPGLLDFWSMHGIPVPIVRGRLEHEVIAAQKRSMLSLYFHPAPREVWAEFSEKIRFRPCDYEQLQIVDDVSESGCALRIAYNDGEHVQVRLPHCAMLATDDVRYWSNDIGLNEFGLFYVAFYILGNYVRYFPDKWLLDVERSTPLVLAVEQLIAEAKVRVPLLLWSELSQCYWVPGRMSSL